MFKDIEIIGNDLEFRGRITSPTIKITLTRATICRFDNCATAINKRVVGRPEYAGDGGMGPGVRGDGGAG